MNKLDTFLFGKHLEDDEAVSQIVHRYWGVATQTLFWPTILFLLGVASMIIAPVGLVLTIMGGWCVFAAVWWVRRFLDYYLDVWIVTDHGVIALEWKGWFHRQSARILYSDIQGVSYEVKGLLETLNRVGTVTIEKISTGGTFALPSVRYPKRVETLILNNMEEYLHRKNLKNAKHVQDLLAEFVAEKVQIRTLPGDQREKRTSSIVTRLV